MCQKSFEYQCVVLLRVFLRFFFVVFSCFFGPMFFDVLFGSIVILVKCFVLEISICVL